MRKQNKAKSRNIASAAVLALILILMVGASMSGCGTRMEGEAGSAQGTQGGKAEDVQYAFDEYGHGAIVNSSRGIICAWQKTGKEGKDFGEAARDAAIAMREDLKKYITVV